MTKEQENKIIDLKKGRKFYRTVLPISIVLILILSTVIVLNYFNNNYEIEDKHSIQLITIFEAVLLFIVISIIDFAHINIMRIKSQSWLQTNCTVLKSFADTEKRSRYIVNVPRIYYSYFVNGEEFVSDKFSYQTSWFSNQKEVLRMLQKYEEGKSYICFYNPNNPDQSVLER